MINKKDKGGLAGASDNLLQPGDQNLDENNLLTSSTNNKLSVGTFGGGRSILTKLQNYGFDSNGYEHGKIDRREWDEYDRLIEGPFSLYDKNLDDRRAEGQGFGEKVINALGKFAVKTPVHILGSTYGIIDGLGEVASDAYTNGFASSNWNRFFNNDFQRSLDDFNESLDNKLPHYYSSQERDLNFGQSVFGKGAANFWTNDFSQGLSFVAGAVLSEYVTRGVSKLLIPAKVANKLKGIAAIRATTYGQKAINANKNLQKINRAERIYDGLTTGRRLLTGAFYESGVEARHNYDATLDRLNELHLENIGTPPTAEDQARMKDVAIKVSNGVFAGNAALVGYSNLLMFRRIFGSGLTKNKNFANKIIKDPKTGKLQAAHKDWGKFRTTLDKYGYVAYRPFYEGVVEEGGQKTLDIAGQYAAEDMYLDQKSPSQLDAVREILEHTHDGMAEAYGSAEGQKEIFLGTILAAIGLPSFISKNEKGETTFKPGYGKTGGLVDFFKQYAEGKKEVEDLVTYMNENPDALAGIKNNFDMLNGIKIADDKRDYADASNNDFGYKNADHDAFFAYVHSRLKGGYFGDVMDSLDDIGNMDLDSFETMFNYETQTESMSKKERETFLSERKNTVITTHKARANKIKEIYNSLDNTKINDPAKKMIAQALSSTSDLDAREQKLISEVEETGEFSLTAIVDKEENDKQANDNIFTKLKNFTMKSIGMKAKSIMENSETGQEIKREIGIKEFTAPGHPALVFQRMANKIIELEKKRDAALNDENPESYVELDDKIKTLKDELSELVLSINQGLAPEISEEEQQILDQYKKKNPAGYELNKEEIIKKLQDLRKIRAKRHQMLNLVQQLIDPDAANDKIQQFEKLIADSLSEEERKKLPPAEQVLLRKYKGKIIEFEYTNSKGETKTNRVYVKDGSEKGLVKIPNDETFRLLQRQKVLLDKKIKTPDDLAELTLIKEELAKSEHVVKYSTFNFGFLEKAKNITILTEQELLLKKLQVVTSVLQDSLAENLAVSLQAIAASKEKVISLAQQVKDIKIAVQQAKVNKRGALYVNLNAIGRKGVFSLESALNILNELKTEEGAYEQQIQDYTQYLNVLQDNSLRIQVIHTALTNPEIISNLLDKSASPTDIFDFINELLGLTSLEEFYKNLGEKGFFDVNELTAIAGQKNKDGGYDVDNQLLQELFDLANSNITEDYLNLMNSDLVAFKDELKLLSQHRQDVERMLNKMVNPITKQIVFFPEEGLTEDDLKYLSYQLKMIDTDIETLEGIINMLEAEAEQNFRDTLNSDLIQERRNAQQAEQIIANSLNEYIQWLKSLENEDTENTEEFKQDFELAEELPPRDFSPAFINVGFNKTAGDHIKSLKIQNKYQSMLDNNQELTKAEKLQFEHAKAQSRFFRHSYDILDYSKNTGAKLQIVTRYNIRPEWKNKFVFYDAAKSTLGKPIYQYADNLTINKDKDETFEDIKLLLVDAQGAPILVDGEFAYTSMTSSALYREDGVFKGQAEIDIENGEVKEEVIKFQEAFIKQRNSLLTDNTEKFFYITKKSRGLAINRNLLSEEQEPLNLEIGLGKLRIKKNNKLKIAKEEDLKEISISIALTQKGDKSNAKVDLFGFQVAPGFVYVGSSGFGALKTNNLIQVVVSNLSENRVNSLYNLSRYYATKSTDKGINIEGKGFTTLVQDQTRYRGSKSGVVSPFDIYLQGDSIVFGDKKQVITFEQLKNSKKYETINNEYKDFLRTLRFNIDSARLTADINARAEALKASSRLKGTKKEFVDPAYEKFKEVIVNDDLSTTTIEWDNYTHYILSGANGREVEDVPALFRLPDASESTNVKQATIPQFLNVYLLHSEDAVSLPALSVEKEVIIETNYDPTIVEDNSQEEPEQDPNKTLEQELEDVQEGVKKGTHKVVVIPVTLLDGSIVELEKIVKIEEETNSSLEGIDTTVDSNSNNIINGLPKGWSQSDGNEIVSDDEVEPFFLSTMAEAPSDVDLDSQLNWFNANMPKDSKGNPLVSLDLIQGLIDNKAYGKFTKDGNILLSELMDVPGIVYHESWHAVTRRFISPKQRFALYDEVRGIRGETQTYKGVTKKMSELTDKEADEWLAEEFREYVLARGNYKVGDRVEKSLMDRIFDKIFSLLNFFINNKSQAQLLMSQLNSGYFSNPTTNITVYDTNTEAYYEATKLTATMRNNAMQGMTVILFNKNIFNLSDFANSNTKVQEQLTAAIRNAYGDTNTRGTVYSQMQTYINNAIKIANPTNKIKLEKTQLAIRDNWEQLKSEHLQYIKRFNVKIDSEIDEENEKTREQFQKPQNEIDPSVYLPKAVRILLGTLPKHIDNKTAVVNSSGLPSLVDFGNIINFMYKEFANVSPNEVLALLKSPYLQNKRPEIKTLIKRLGIESDDIQDLSTNKMKMLIQTMMHFNQSNNKFYTQIMSDTGSRMLVDSNKNKVEDKVKELWKQTFKNNIQTIKGLGKEKDGKLILNADAKIKIGERESDKKTFAEWGNFGKRTPEQSLIILRQLGITFSNKNEFIAKYNEDDTFRRSITFIIKEAATTALSDMFESNEQGNLKKLIELEVLYNPLIVNNQHRSSEGKTVHGVNLKNYLDVLISDLTTVTSNGYKVANTDYIEGLLKYDNLKNSIYLNSMLLAPQNTLEVVILEGMRHEFGKGKSLSKGSPSDIGVMLVNAVLSEGIIPILRTADKKTEYGLKFKTPNLNLNLDTMLIRLQGYLADEIRAASIFNSQRKSKLHRVAQLKDKGGNLRYFEKIVPSLDRSAYGKKLTENKIKELISSPKVVNDLQQFLQNEIAKTKTVLTNYNIALDGIDSNLLLTAKSIASQTGKYPLDVIAEQFVYEYITGVNEQGKLLLGDFALYSDLFKRTAGLSGTKAYPTSNPSILNWMNKNMPNLFSNKEHSNSLQVVHRAAVKIKAPYLNQYIEALKALGASQAILQNVIEVYSNMEEFDGGGFITLDAYRSLMYRIGKWTDNQEAFYQNLATPGYVLKAEDMAIIPPIKPQFFGPFVVDNLRLMTFHKFALFPIIPGITTNTAFDTINQDMINNNIDYMIFEPKVGGITANLQGYDPFYEEAPEGYSKYKPMSLDNTNTPLGLQELSFSELGIQLETAPKTSEYVREGSQFRSLLLVNAYNQGKLAEGYEDFKGAIDKYHEINNELIEKDFKNLLEKLKLVKQKDGRYKLSSKDAKAFQEALEREFKKRDNPLHTIDSIKKLFQSDTKFIEQLFEKDKIERLFYSLVTNNVIKRKMKGGQFVLQASTGFESTFKAIKQGDFERAASLGIDLHESQLKPLKFYRKADPNNLNSETLAMQVYLPSRFKDMLGITIEDINDRRISPEILQLIGFRIPTEGLNSIDFIEVVGFLPKSFGDTVIVPSEIVGKAGSDYDIDKLTIYFPHTEIGEDGVIRRVAYDSNKTVQEQSKEALQNEVQNISKAILSHPVSFEQLISPVGAYQLKDLALKVAMKRNPENFNPDGTKIKLPLSETLSLENMLKTSYRMFSGLGGIGIVATSSTQHAKGQRAGVNWNFADHPDIVFNFEGQGFGLSSVYDINNKNKISSTIGQYVTGYVDVTKADFIFDINGGLEYAPIHMLLVRSRVPLESVVYFMSQPIIDDYVQMKEKFQPMYERFPIKTNQTIVDELLLKYKTDVKSIPVTFSENNLFDMIGSTSLNPMQKAAQIKILEDFLRYEKLAKDLMLLKDASSFDTAELSGSIDIRYAKQAISRLQQTGKFINLDKLLLGNVEGASTVASYVKLMSELDGLFADFKLGEYILDAKTFIDGKLFEATDPELKFYKDDVIYKMSKFENFLASTVIQNTTWEYEKLSDRTSDLFKGPNSLPRRISALKTDPVYRDNLLIQELLPIFQVYTENSPEQTVDTMKLFSKSLQPYDIDILADSFMEIKEINPELAKDLIIFSALQSGLNYSPNSFFQVIPGVEVLDVMAKYFKQNNHINRTSNLIKNDNMDELWTDFHQNYTDNSQIVPNVYRKTIENFYKLKRNDEFVSVTSKTGEVQVGGITKNVYKTNLYKRFGKTKDGKTNYKQILKKGVPFHLIEATGPNTLSIVSNNLSIVSNNLSNKDKNLKDISFEHLESLNKPNTNPVLQGFINHVSETKLSTQSSTSVKQGIQDISSLGKLEGEKVSTEKGAIGVNKQQLMMLLGSTMYNKPLAQVAVKELLQNSFDGIKARQNSQKINEDNSSVTPGSIDIEINMKERTISIKDDGIGMTPDIVKNAFLSIGGTNKEGLSTGERSGGLGLAKVQFLMGSESIKVVTIKNGIKTTIEATNIQLYNDDFEIQTEETSENNGTFVEVKIPKNYKTIEGATRDIDFPGYYGGWQSYDILKKPLIGNVNVNVKFTSLYETGKKEVVPIGLNSTKEILPPHFAKISFAWGEADIYMSEEKQESPKHQILSSGIYQFQHNFRDPSTYKSVPYDIVVNIKPSVTSTSEQYPFNNQREDFKNTVSNDISTLNSYLLKYARGESEKEAVDVFSDIKPLAQVDPNKILTPEERQKLYDDIDKRVEENKKARIEKGEQTIEEIWRTITINSGRITNDITGETKTEKEYKSTFSSDKKIEDIASVNTEFFNPAFPQFHNNTNVNYLSTPGAVEFITDFGNTVLQMVRFAGDELGYDYKKLKTNSEEKFFAGVSVDKTYGGIHIRKIINAIFVNPLAFNPSNLEEAVGIALHITIHEINHTTASGEGANFTTDLATLYGKIYSTGKYGLYEGLFRSVFKKHFETFKTLKHEYDKSNTKNLSKSFEGNEIKRGGQGINESNAENVSTGQSSKGGYNRDTKNIKTDKLGDVIASNLSKNKKVINYDKFNNKLSSDIEGFKKFATQPSTNNLNAPDGLPGIPRTSTDCQ